MKTLNGYEVVDAKARADIETLKQSGGGSSGGSGVKIIRLYNKSGGYDDEAKAAIWDYICRFSAAGGIVPDDTIFYIQSQYSDSIWLPATYVNAKKSTYGNFLDAIGFDSSDSRTIHRCDVYFNNDGSFNRMQTTRQDLVSSSSSSSWEIHRSSSVDGDTYSYTEIFIYAYNNNTSAYLTSHVVFDGSLGSSTHMSYPFSGSNEISWLFDGLNLSVNDSSVEIRYFAVKSS